MDLLQLLRLKPYGKVNNYYEGQFSQKLLDHIDNQEYEAAKIVLNDASSVTRYYLLRGVAKSQNGLRLAQRWAKVESTCFEAYLLLGVCYKAEAWLIRNEDPIYSASGHRLKKFNEYIDKAKKYLLHAISLDDSRADAYGELIQIHYVKGTVLNNIYQLYRKGISLEADNFACVYLCFLATTKKYSGSHDDMFKFVTSVVERAPQGSYNHLLIAYAYNELVMNEWEVVKRRWIKLKERMMSSDFSSDVVTALFNWLNADSKNYKQKTFDKAENAGGKFYGLNQFATALYWTGAEEAKVIVKALLGEISVEPWCFYTSSKRDSLQSAFVYDKVCRELSV